MTILFINIDGLFVEYFNWTETLSQYFMYNFSNAQSVVVLDIWSSRYTEALCVYAVFSGDNHFLSDSLVEKLKTKSWPFGYEPGHEKMCLVSYANNKGTDQPAHPRSLIMPLFSLPR